ncbi:MAG: hypothetical protein A2X66_03750 [Ignavibacteria bacterium GWA2_54_16]|nr:MAG: hypothetical protein A2X66_03750 [Ignavibacteria bacterium GWA2_54_16]
MFRASRHRAPFDSALTEFLKLPAFAKELRRAGAQGATPLCFGGPEPNESRIVSVVRTILSPHEVESLRLLFERAEKSLRIRP